MEQNKFELLEEVEQDIPAAEVKEELKEYEKLLLAERDRKDNEKAINLVKFGCFEQKQEATIDFSSLELVSTEKKYRGLYNLYRNLDTMQLLFICPLVENNKGDVDERKDMKPYAYDVIYLEAMDNETFEMVAKAAKNNLKNKVSFAYKMTFVLYFVQIAVTLAMFIWNLIYFSAQYVWYNCITSAIANSQSYFTSILISTPLLVLMMISYKKYKAE